MRCWREAPPRPPLCEENNCILMADQIMIISHWNEGIIIMPPLHCSPAAQWTIHMSSICKCLTSIDPLIAIERIHMNFHAVLFFFSLLPSFIPIPIFQALLSCQWMFDWVFIPKANIISEMRSTISNKMQYIPTQSQPQTSSQGGSFRKTANLAGIL